MQCPVCGSKYAHPVPDAECASKCPHYAECDNRCCPTCYYENVLDPEWYARVAAEAKPALAKC